MVLQPKSGMPNHGNWKKKNGNLFIQHKFQISEQRQLHQSFSEGQPVVLRVLMVDVGQYHDSNQQHLYPSVSRNRQSGENVGRNQFLYAYCKIRQLFEWANAFSGFLLDSINICGQNASKQLLQNVVNSLKTAYFPWHNENSKAQSREKCVL